MLQLLTKKRNWL